jgi:outer membrane immunogenic protein
MSHMKSKWVAAAVAVLAVVGGDASFNCASAADLPSPAIPYAKAPPTPAVQDWTGFYLGLGVGTRSSQIDGDMPQAGLVANFAVCAPAFPPFSFTCTGESLNSTAFRINPYLGYNYQFAAQWLAGIEGDIGLGSKAATLAGLFGPNSGASESIGAQDSFTVKTGWDASVRARLGYLVAPSFLLYGTAGAAWQRIEATSICGLNAFGCAPGNLFGGYTPTVTDAATKLGYTVGGGFETMLWRNWIVRGEYRFSDYGTITNTDTRSCLISGGCATANVSVVETLRLRTQTASFGIAYKFSQ